MKIQNNSLHLSYWIQPWRCWEKLSQRWLCGVLPNLKSKCTLFINLMHVTSNPVSLWNESHYSSKFFEISYFSLKCGHIWICDSYLEWVFIACGILLALYMHLWYMHSALTQQQIRWHLIVPIYHFTDEIWWHYWAPMDPKWPLFLILVVCLCIWLSTDAWLG